MTRFSDWQSRLESFLAANRHRVFVYGSWDCFQFVRGAVDAETGSDIGERFQPYHSRFGYLRQMMRFCGSGSLITFAEDLLESYGFTPIEPIAAQRGDVVVTAQPAFGIISLNGRKLAMLQEPAGIIEQPLSTAVRAWRI